jgi:GAF domain-containing protein/anti-sigma regulatory factor (Ser/Thr protein kinase)
MALPLASRGRVIGVLDVQSVEGNVFVEEDVAALQTMADQLANAIESARLYKEANRHVEELTALHNIDVAITSTLNLNKVLEIIYEQVSELMGIPTFYIGLHDEERDEIDVRLVVDEGKRKSPCVMKIQEEEFTGWVIRNRKPLWVGDTDRDELTVEGAAIGEQTRSFMVLPLIVRDQVIGVISAQSSVPDAFSQDDQRLFLGIAHQAAIAITNARLFEETNRRLTETRLLQEVMQAAASTLDFDQVLARTIDTLNRTLGIEYLSFVLPDEQGGMVMHPSRIGYAVSPEAFRVTLDASVSGLVYKTGEPQIIPDVREVPYYSEGVSEVRSELAVPVKVAGRVVAVLNAESAELSAYGEEDLRLFSAVAAQLGVVLENARLFEETDRRLAETRLLQEVMQAAASTLDFDEVLARTIDTLHRTLGIEYLTFVLPDEHGTDLVAHPSWAGYTTDSETRIPMDSSVCGRVYQSGEPQILSDVREVPYYFETAPGVRSELVVPVKVADRIIAALDAESPRIGAFTEDHLRLFSAVAAQLGIVLENARLFEETKRRLAETALIQEVMLAGASTLDFDLVLERTVKALNRALSIDRLGFLLPDEGGDALVSHPSLVGFAEAPSQTPIEGTLVGQAYLTGQPVMVQDLTKGMAYAEHDPDVRSALAVPVRFGDRIVAVLHAESVAVGAFDWDEFRLFTTLAGQLGMTLENARLYRRLETQAAELAQAYNELQEIDRLRAQLVQNVSHELRTPLGLIKGYVELMVAGDLGRILDSQQAALQVIRERIATLTRLINNLTMLQAVPREALILAPVSVVEVVQQVLKEFRRSADKAGIVFEESLPVGLPSVVGDRERLELVFGHLVDNAIKFSPEGGPVVLQAQADQEMVRVSITDAGIGIPPDRLDRIFERFYQVNGSTKRRFGGMGVGLALVWEIVEAHGGTVGVESEPGKGSTFTVALPRAAEEIDESKSD